MHRDTLQRVEQGLTGYMVLMYGGHVGWDSGANVEAFSVLILQRTEHDFRQRASSFVGVSARAAAVLSMAHRRVAGVNPGASGPTEIPISGGDSWGAGVRS